MKKDWEVANGITDAETKENYKRKKCKSLWLKY